VTPPDAALLWMREVLAPVPHRADALDLHAARCWHGLYTASPCLMPARWQEPITVEVPGETNNTGAWRACDAHRREGMIPLIPRHPEPDGGW
jgi:hypothetical protein